MDRGSEKRVADRSDADLRLVMLMCRSLSPAIRFTRSIIRLTCGSRPGTANSEVLSQIGIGALVSLRTGCVNGYQRQASATYWHAVAYRSGHFRGNPSEGWRHSYQRDVMAPEPVSLRRLCSDRPDRGCTDGSKARPGRTKSRAGLRLRKETMPCRRNSRSCHRSDLLP